MGAIAITVSVVVLVLLLTDSLSLDVVRGFSLKVIGWILVVLLLLGLVGNLLEAVPKFVKDLIEFLKQDASEFVKRHRPSRARTRAELGYEDSNENEG